jgi:hypothetical protein
MILCEYFHAHRTIEDAVNCLGPRREFAQSSPDDYCVAGRHRFSAFAVAGDSCFCGQVAMTETRWFA